jgi:hypothetical protein
MNKEITKFDENGVPTEEYTRKVIEEGLTEYIRFIAKSEISIGCKSLVETLNEMNGPITFTSLTKKGKD